MKRTKDNISANKWTHNPMERDFYWEQLFVEQIWDVKTQEAENGKSEKSNQMKIGYVDRSTQIARTSLCLENKKNEFLNIIYKWGIQSHRTQSKKAKHISLF